MPPQLLARCSHPAIMPACGTPAFKLNLVVLVQAERWASLAAANEHWVGGPACQAPSILRQRHWSGTQGQALTQYLSPGAPLRGNRTIPAAIYSPRRCPACRGSVCPFCQVQGAGFTFVPVT